MVNDRLKVIITRKKCKGMEGSDQLPQNISDGYSDQERDG